MEKQSCGSFALVRDESVRRKVLQFNTAFKIKKSRYFFFAVLFALCLVEASSLSVFGQPVNSPVLPAGSGTPVPSLTEPDHAFLQLPVLDLEQKGASENSKPVQVGDE